MASPARDARLAAQALGFTEIVERGKGHLKTHNPNTGVFAIDAQAGGVGWHYGTNLDQEIDTAWVASAGTWDWEVTKNDFHLFVRDSVPVSYRYEDVATGHFVEITWSAVQWVNNEGQSANAASFSQVTPAIMDGIIRWNDIASGWDVRLDSQPTRLAKWLSIDSLAALGTPSIGGTNIRLRFQLTFQRSNNLDVYVDGVRWAGANNTFVETSGDIEFRDATSSQSIFWFRKPFGHDANVKNVAMLQRVRRSGANFFSEIETPYTWLQNAAYPVELDDTIDAQVAANDRDSIQKDTGQGGEPSNDDIFYFSTSYPTDPSANEFVAHGFTGITIPAGATIGSNTYWQPKVYSASFDSPNLITYGEDTSAPATYSTGLNNISARTRTTANVAWNAANVGTGFVSSPSIATIIQELVDSYAPYSSGVIALVHIAQSTTEFYIYGYTNSSADAAKIHIEFTSGTTYNDAFSLGRTLAISESSLVTKDDAFSLGKTLTIPFAVTGTIAYLLDDFNRANEGPPPSSSWGGQMFDSGAHGGLRVVNNQLAPNTGATYYSSYWNTAFVANQFVFCTLATKTATGNYLNLYTRLQDPGAEATIDGYVGSWDASSNQCVIYRMTNAALTSLATGSFTMQTGDRLKFESIGTTHSMYYQRGASGWTLIISAEDGTYSGSGKLGILLGGATDWRVEEFFGGETGASYNDVITLARRHNLILFGDVLTSKPPYFADSGASINGTTSLAVPYPTGTMDGDMLLMFISNKYPTNYPATPANWTLDANGRITGGFGAAGIDAGQATMTVFWRLATGSMSGTQTVTITGGNTALGQMIAVRGDYPLTVSFTTGRDASPGLLWQATGTSQLDVRGLDLVYVGNAINSDQASFTTGSLSINGITNWGAFTERADVGTNSGQDCGLMITEHPALSGTATGVPIYTATASASSTNYPAGATVFVRVRQAIEEYINFLRLHEVAVAYDSINSYLVTMSLGKNVASAFSADGSTYSPVFSLSKTDGIVIAGNLDYLATISLARYLGITNTATFQFSDVITLAKSLDIVTQTNIDISSSLSLGRIEGISVASLLTALASLLLSKQVDISISSINQIVEAITLSDIRGISTASEFSIEVLMTLQRSLGIVLGAEKSVETSISLGKQLDINLTATMIALAAITLAKELDISLTGNLEISSSLLLGKILGIVTSAEVLTGVSTYNETFTLAKSLLNTFTAQYIANPSLLLDKTAGITLDTTATLNASILLGKAVSVSILANLILNGLMSLGKSAGASTSANLTLEQSIGIGTSLGIGGNVTADMLAQLSLGRSVGVSPTVTLDLVEDLTLGKIIQISIVGGLVYDDAFALGIQKAISLVDQLIQVLGMIPAKLVINDSEIWTLSLSDMLVNDDIISEDIQSDISIEDTDHV